MVNKGQQADIRSNTRSFFFDKPFMNEQHLCPRSQPELWRESVTERLREGNDGSSQWMESGFSPTLQRCVPQVCLRAKINQSLPLDSQPTYPAQALSSGGRHYIKLAVFSTTSLTEVVPHIPYGSGMDLILHCIEWSQTHIDIWVYFSHRDTES